MANLVSVETKEWLTWVGTTGAPLCRCKQGEKEVQGIASGWLLDIDGRRILVTAAHSIRDRSDWGIDLGVDESGGNELYWPREFKFYDDPDWDACAARVSSDILPVYQERGPSGFVGHPIPYHVFKHSDLVSPDASSVFAFSGCVYPEMHGADIFVRHPHVYPGLQLVEKSGHRLKFSLPVEHPGHEAFKGCSGAPIVDINRRCVGLVTGGDLGENAIFGTSIDGLIPWLQAL